MYCPNCGKELVNDETFCPECGKNQKEEKRQFINNGEDKKKLYAFYVAIATSPMLFIFRMLGQTKQHIEAGVGGSWRDHDVSIVPGNIQAIMILILVVSTILNIMLRKNSNSTDNSKAGITNTMLVINVLFGMFITFTEF